jgi:hypothetical protein
VARVDAMLVLFNPARVRETTRRPPVSSHRNTTVEGSLFSSTEATPSLQRPTAPYLAAVTASSLIKVAKL